MHQLISDKIKKRGVWALVPERLLENIGHEEDQQNLLRALIKGLGGPGKIELIYNTKIRLRSFEIVDFIKAQLVERLAFFERSFENKRLEAALERIKMQDHTTLRIGLLIEE